MPAKKLLAKNAAVSVKVASRKPTRSKPVKTQPTSLELFLDLIAGIYPEDKLTPGVVLSHLQQGPHTGAWYGAAYRYPGERNVHGYLKRVRIGQPAYGHSIEDVVFALAEPWTSQNIVGVRDELRKRTKLRTSGKNTVGFGHAIYEYEGFAPGRYVENV